MSVLIPRDGLQFKLRHGEHVTERDRGGFLCKAMANGGFGRSTCRRWGQDLNSACAERETSCGDSGSMDSEEVGPFEALPSVRNPLE
jgi:hypothetical protein